jgi:hypothetical protein
MKTEAYHANLDHSGIIRRTLKKARQLSILKLALRDCNIMLTLTASNFSPAAALVEQSLLLHRCDATAAMRNSVLYSWKSPSRRPRYMLASQEEHRPCILGGISAVSRLWYMTLPRDAQIGCVFLGSSRCSSAHGV